jgi:hypothetical protein
VTGGVIAGIVGGLVVAVMLALLAWGREKSQQRHESRMALREERIKAYSEVLKTTSTVDARDRRTIDLGVKDMLQAVSVAQVVAGGNQEVLDSLEDLRNAWNKLREEAEKGIRDIDEQKVDKREKENRRCRQKFLNAAWKQTGQTSG